MKSEEMIQASVERNKTQKWTLTTTGAVNGLDCVTGETVVWGEAVYKGSRGGQILPSTFEKYFAIENTPRVQTLQQVFAAAGNVGHPETITGMETKNQVRYMTREEKAAWDRKRATANWKLDESDEFGDI